MDVRSAQVNHAAGDGIGRDFATTLEELKHRGCSLLVTGDVDSRTRAKQTRRLFGDPTIDRERVLVLTDTDRRQCIDTLPPGMTPDHPSVHLLNYHEPSAVSVRADADESGVSSRLESETAVDGLTDLRDAITDTIVGIQTRATFLAAGALRLGLTDLSVLLDLYGIDATKSFVRTTSSEIRDARGMGFCYLSEPSDDPIVRSLLPFFDIHIELREPTANPARHRWHLCAYDLSSAWLPV